MGGWKKGHHKIFLHCIELKIVTCANVLWCPALCDHMGLACQAPMSIGYPRQEYWSGLLFPPLGDLPDPRIEPESPALPALQVNSLPTEPLGKPKDCGSVQFSHSVMSNSLLPHEPQHTRPPCPSPTPRVHPNPCPLSQWCHPTT